MALTVSHGCFQASCSTFDAWRNRLAEAAGYAVWDVKFKGMPPKPTVMVDWGHISCDNLRGAWPEPPADPLMVLIAHMDEEGVINVPQLLPLARRLRELLPKLDHPGDEMFFRRWTVQFADGLERAADRGEYVEFH